MNRDELTSALTHTPADERAVAEGCYVDLERALRVEAFFRDFCRHHKGRWAGKPVTLLDWEWADLILPVFGWTRADGTRRYRRVYVEMGKKNGKTLIASCVSLYGLVADGEMGAEVYCAAFGRDQAKIVYRDVERTVRKSPELSRILKVYTASNRIVNETEGSFLVAISGEAEIQEGINAHMIIFDEVHTQRTRALWDALEDAGSARTQPLMMCITTAGDQRSIVARELHDYSVSIAEGRIDDPSFYGLIYAAGSEDPWDDPATWEKANPSLGETITLENLEEAARKARVSPAARNNFRRRRLCIWVEGADSWLDPEAWDACVDPDLTWADIDGRRVLLGVDLASVRDLVALVAWILPEDGDEEEPYRMLARFFAPERADEKREQENRTRFDTWIEQGWIETVPGETYDQRSLIPVVTEIGERCDVVEVAFDRWLATQPALLLDGEGVPTALVSQGFNDMTEPIAEFEARLLTQGMRFQQNPTLRWTFLNACLDIDALGRKRLSKKRSPEKIDAASAALTALARILALRHEETGPSVYESRGPLVF